MTVKVSGQSVRPRISSWVRRGYRADWTATKLRWKLSADDKECAALKGLAKDCAGTVRPLCRRSRSEDARLDRKGRPGRHQAPGNVLAANLEAAAQGPPGQQRA
jgi:hypothetical protein